MTKMVYLKLLVDEIHSTNVKLPESTIRGIAGLMMFSGDNAKKKISLLKDFEGEEKDVLRKEMGGEDDGINSLIKECYDLLGLETYFTTGEDETRAWTIKNGTKAPGAAGKIHTDFERGFIKAEVVSFDDLKEYGSMNALKEKGLVRLEGKEYIVKDGDVIVFRFNV